MAVAVTAVVVEGDWASGDGGEDEVYRSGSVAAPVTVAYVTGVSDENSGRAMLQVLHVARLPKL